LSTPGDLLKKNVKNKISMDQFVDHFKNLISNDNVDNGLDTTDTMECVFEELDKPFTENEIACSYKVFSIYFPNVCTFVFLSSVSFYFRQNGYHKKLLTDTMECVFEELDKPFTENEIETCIKGLNRNKSPGVDNILNEYVF
jgi:hypoxanthine phosphoribosyltransferase